MTKIQVTQDDILDWQLVPEEWGERPYYNTLDLPDDKIEWIRRVEAESIAVQQYLEAEMIEYYAARWDARQKEER